MDNKFEAPRPHHGKKEGLEVRYSHISRGTRCDASHKEQTEEGLMQILNSVSTQTPSSLRRQNHLVAQLARSNLPQCELHAVRRHPISPEWSPHTVRVSYSVLVMVRLWSEAVRMVDGRSNIQVTLMC
jgi:hypothetical protein